MLFLRFFISKVDTEESAGLTDELRSHFKLAVDMVRGGIREFVNDTDGPAFLESQLMGLAMDGTVGQSARTCQLTGAHIHNLRTCDPM